MPNSPEIRFARLTDVSADDIIIHMSDPRVAEHMPLAARRWDHDACAEFVASKEERWRLDGLGHWAILLDGRYAGWGGFQKEGDEWDFGLVLTPEFFGHGLRITREALEIARQDPRIPYVTFLLAPSRPHLRGLERMGATFIEEIRYEGHSFLKYRMETI